MDDGQRFGGGRYQRSRTSHRPARSPSIPASRRVRVGPARAWSLFLPWMSAVPMQARDAGGELAYSGIAGAMPAAQPEGSWRDIFSVAVLPLRV